MIDLTININIECQGKLTPKGRVVLRSAYADLDLTPPACEDGVLRMPLWKLMQIFGPSIAGGQIFENNELSLHGSRGL